MGWFNLNRRQLNGKNFEIKTSKTGDNYFCAVTINDEPILMIISPPTDFKRNIGGGGNFNPTTAEIGINIQSEKQLAYDGPVVLFNKNNKTGFEINPLLSEVKNDLKSCDPAQSFFKVNLQKLENPEIRDFSSTKTIKTNSSIVQMYEEKFVLRPNPALSDQKIEIINLILAHSINTFFPESGTFRTNIMVYNPERNTLKIVASFHMDGHIDKNLEISIDKGGAGKSFRENKEHMVDLNVNGHEFWGIDPNTVWKDMLSIISVPIPNSDNIPLAILSVDCNLPYTGARFEKEEVKRNLRREAEIIGKIMEFA